MKNNLGVYISAFFLLFSGILFWKALDLNYYGAYGPGPGLLPIWANGILIILSLISLVFCYRKSDILLSEVLPKGRGLGNVLACIGALVLFMLVVDYTGFVAGSILMLFPLFSRGYKWHWSLGLSVGVTLLLFWTFGLILQVPLPVNEFGW